MSLPHRPRAARGASLTILRHHRVYAAGERPLYRLGVSEGVLAAQLELLARLDLAPLTVAEGLRRLADGGAGRWVALSFDDGYADNVHRALPLLERFGARATVYLAAGWIDERRAPWWDTLAHALEHARTPRLDVTLGDAHIVQPLADPRDRQRALQALLPALRAVPEVQRDRLDVVRASLGVTEPAPCALASWDEAASLARAGIELGAHTLTHPFLSLLPPAAQHAEIAGSVTLIRERLGVSVAGLAYPGGDHDARSVAAARAAGLSYAVTTRAGDVAPGDAPWTLHRRGWSEGACLGPGGRFSSRLATAELDGAFDRMRATAEPAA